MEKLNIKTVIALLEGIKKQTEHELKLQFQGCGVANEHIGSHIKYLKDISNNKKICHCAFDELGLDDSLIGKYVRPCGCDY